MRFFTADKIYSCSSENLDGKIIVTDDNGKIEDFISSDSVDNGKIEDFKGILCPGFVNAHCHLELSHMIGKLETGTGLLSFIGNVVKLRDATEEFIQDCIHKADLEMFQNGIVAIGDISNQNDTADTKSRSSIRYYTFLEMFDFMQAGLTQSTIQQYSEVIQAFQSNEKDKVNYSPHAPYSVSVELLGFINEQANGEATFSVHNQETPPEDELFLHGSGAFHDFYKSFDLSLDFFKATNKTAIHYILDHFANDKKMLFVHNTLTSAEDVNAAKKVCKEVYWASCPNANLYIENMLPDYEMFIAQGAKVCLGTDSLTSNWQLSILEEMKSIKRFKSFVSLERLFEWACINGAQALGFDDTLGSFEVGKTPGIVHVNVSEFDSKGEFEISKANSTRIL